MNSVALPASTAQTSTLSSEADLVRRAGRGEASAFDELFRRHSAPAWRLAQAVAPDAESAQAGFGDGFVRAVRGFRAPRRSEAAAFRPELLASVYRAAVGHAYDRAVPAPARARSASGPVAAMAEAAFRSLPERWRAAIWLSEVENGDTARVAYVLGVSVPVAEQLILRARRGLAGRYHQARKPMPEHIGDVLRQVALATPTGLAATTTARWSSAGGDRSPLTAPLAGWLEKSGMRPMAVAAGALIGLGLVGLGVIPAPGPIQSALGGAGTGGVPGPVPVRACLGLDCPNPAGTASLANGSGASAAGSALVGPNLAGSAGSLVGSGSSGGALATGGTGSGSGASGGTGSGPAGGGGAAGGGTTGGGTGGGTSGGGGTIGGGTTGGGGVTPPVTVPGGGGTTINLAPVATISSGSGGITLQVLPTTGGGVTVTVPLTIPSITTPPTTAPGGGSSNPVSSVVSTVTTIAGVVGGLVGGVGSVLGGGSSSSSTTSTTLPLGL